MFLISYSYSKNCLREHLIGLGRFIFEEKKKDRYIYRERKREREKRERGKDS